MNIKRKATLLAYAFVLTGITAGWYQAYLGDQVKDDAWAAMCQLIWDYDFSYQCGDIDTPRTVYMELPEGFTGQYFGGDGAVLISKDIHGLEREAALIHEYVHYLHEQLGLIEIPDLPKAICWSEQEAWFIQSSHERRDYTNWWLHYQQCWIYYGPPGLRARRN